MTYFETGVLREGDVGRLFKLVGHHAPYIYS
jgi:hypothetical protein